MTITIKKFENTFLYDTEFDGEKVVRRKIKLLEEQIQDRATLPTYLIQYENGEKAVCDPGMYWHSQEEADKRLAEEFRSQIQSNLAEIANLHEDNAAFRKALVALNSGWEVEE